MNCPQCGTQTQDGAQFCPQCGAPLSCEITQQPVPADAYQQPEAAAAGDQFAQPGQPQSPYAQPGNPAGIEDKSTMFIVLSVLEFFFAGGLIAIWHRRRRLPVLAHLQLLAFARPPYGAVPRGRPAPFARNPCAYERRLSFFGEAPFFVGARMKKGAPLKRRLFRRARNPA